MIADLIPNYETVGHQYDPEGDTEHRDGYFCMTCKGYVMSEVNGDTCTCDIHGVEVSK